MHAPDSGSSSQKLGVHLNVYCASLTSALETVDDLFRSCTQYKSYKHEQLRMMDVVNMTCLYFTIILHYQDVWWGRHDVMSTQWQQRNNMTVKKAKLAKVWWFALILRVETRRAGFRLMLFAVCFSVGDTSHTCHSWGTSQRSLSESSLSFTVCLLYSHCEKMH